MKPFADSTFEIFKRSDLGEFLRSDLNSSAIFSAKSLGLILEIFAATIATFVEKSPFLESSGCPMVKSALAMPRFLSAVSIEFRIFSCIYFLLYNFMNFLLLMPRTSFAPMTTNSLRNL